MFYHSIKEHDEITTASENGRVPFISAQDIAQVAFDALTAEKSPNTDIYIVGPELLSYDDVCLNSFHPFLSGFYLMYRLIILTWSLQVAELLSSILGRKITHNKISEEERAEILGHFLSPEYAGYIAKIEHLIASGSREEFLELELGERKVVGRVTLLEYLQAKKDLWGRQLHKSIFLHFSTIYYTALKPEKIPRTVREYTHYY